MVSLFLCLCLIALMCEGLPINSQKLKAPNSSHIRITDDPSFEISWLKVESADENDPVLGYKVEVIEAEKVKKIIYRIEKDTHKKITEESLEYPKLNENINGKLTVLTAPADDNPGVIFKGVKLEVPYQIKIFAYTKNAEGPWAGPLKLKVNDD